MGLSLSIIKCVLASTTTQTYTWEKFCCSDYWPLQPSLAQAHLPCRVVVLGSFIVARAWDTILQYKMIPSMHELLIAEYSRIFIQVP